MAATPIGTATKDPDENLDYSIDWSDFLSGDTISAVVWTVTAGLTNITSMFSATSTTIWLGGGVTGTNYTVTAKITTVANRVGERSFQINVVDK